MGRARCSLASPDCNSSRVVLAKRPVWCVDLSLWVGTVLGDPVRVWLQELVSDWGIHILQVLRCCCAAGAVILAWSSSCVWRFEHWLGMHLGHSIWIELRPGASLRAMIHIDVTMGQSVSWFTVSETFPVKWLGLLHDCPVLFELALRVWLHITHKILLR